MPNATDPFWLRYCIYISLKGLRVIEPVYPRCKNRALTRAEETFNAGCCSILCALGYACSSLHAAAAAVLVDFFLCRRDVDIGTDRSHDAEKNEKEKLLDREPRISRFPERARNAVTPFLERDDAQGRRRNFSQFRSFTVRRPCVHLHRHTDRNLHAFYGRRINSNWRLFSMVTRAFRSC